MSEEKIIQKIDKDHFVHSQIQPGKYFGENKLRTPLPPDSKVSFKIEKLRVGLWYISIVIDGQKTTDHDTSKKRCLDKLVNLCNTHFFPSSIDDSI